MKKILLLLFIMLFYSISICCGGQSTQKLPLAIIKKINETYPGFKVAKKSNFGKYFLSLKENYQIDIESYFNTIIIVDLNYDLKKDFTLLLINEKARKFCFVSFISKGDEYTHHMLSSSEWPSEHDGTIWQVMWLKPSGEYGISKEKYFNAPGKDYPFLSDYTEKDIKEYKDAIENYKNMVVIEKTDAPYGAFEADDLFYCKSAYYFKEGQMKSVSKCD